MTVPQDAAAEQMRELVKRGYERDPSRDSSKTLKLAFVKRIPNPRDYSKKEEK